MLTRVRIGRLATAGRGALVTALLAALAACGSGRHEEPGEPTATRLPPAEVAARASGQESALARLVGPAEPARKAKQVLFGDLHVHTTFSADAFIRSLPMLQGEGAHPPADACDYARFCSGLDFWSINDHAEGISPRHWKETKEAIRRCNAVSGDPSNPDLVSFLGWEWTQVGQTPEDHYGHKNVVFRETADDKVPTRPISALNDQLIGAMRSKPPLWQRLRFPILDWPNRQRYFDFGLFQDELAKSDICPPGVDSRKLPDTCHEVASTPQELFEKLNQLGFESMVIPHGTTWGFYTPPGVTLDKQLTAAQNDPDRQGLIEVYSGHGNSEEYRDWKDIDHDAQGNLVCPKPTRTYEPCCWRAGEIVRARCKDVPAAECDKRVAAAQINYLKAGVAGRVTVAGSTAMDWKDCGQCRDCFNPAFTYRPGDSAQYGLAISNFDDPNQVRRFRWGFIASSDNHSARPGTGYKEFGRRYNTETAGARDEVWLERIGAKPPPAAPESEPFDPSRLSGPMQPIQLLDFERQASFFMTGGLVAVHAEGRDRNAIWNALERREVYGTSGDKMLLWFDLLNGPDGLLPMGSDTILEQTPRFRVRAVGAPKQLPGCPAYAMNAMDPQHLKYICRGECWNPSDERRMITRIEVVRIRPQKQKGEPVRSLIDDPWRRFPCTPSQAGCTVEFDDPDFTAGARDVTYYARAIQEPTTAVNAGGMRCTYNEAGECVKANPCYGDYRTPFDEDCLTLNEERAWSSPIYLRH